MMLSQKLKHPSVALTRDVGVFKGVHYPRPRIHPRTDALSPRPARRASLGVPGRARLFMEICSALETRPLAGTDPPATLKPSNIMVTPDEHAKTARPRARAPDRRGDRRSRSGRRQRDTSSASVEYIAPRTDARSDPGRRPGADLYSPRLPRSIFALTGRGPFAGTGAGSARRGRCRRRSSWRAHRHTEARSDPEAGIQACRTAWRNLIHRLMAKKPKHRPESAAIVRQELMPFSEPGSEVTNPRRQCRTGRSVRPGRRPDGSRTRCRRSSGSATGQDVESADVESVDAGPIGAEFRGRGADFAAIAASAEDRLGAGRRLVGGSASSASALIGLIIFVLVRR